jgi:hypothetical protein
MLELIRAITLSLDYILKRQLSDGSWVDWDLPPGPSSIWTTAFVGCKLRSLPAGFNASVSTSLAAEWLQRKMFADGGWGYNEEAGSDADSTALAILFLASQGRPVGEASYQCLESFQRPDGGFATYRGQPALGSWAVSHADVTPAAILAMMTKYGAETPAVAKGLEFVLANRASSGIWQSFWWTSFLYSTEGCLSLLKTAGRNMDLRGTRETLLSVRPQHPFESALLVSCILSLRGDPAGGGEWPGRELRALVDDLLENQQPDGSWRSGPMLRVTRRDCFEAWKCGDPDELFWDQNRLFTTATVLDALSTLFQEQRNRAVFG